MMRRRINPCKICPSLEEMTASFSASLEAMPITGIKGSEKRLRFIFIAPVVNEEFYRPVKKGMHDAAKLMNVDASFTGTFGVDLKDQARMIISAASSGYDGIAANLIDPHAFDAAVKEALNQGVPVVAFNTDAGSHNARLSAIGQNLVEAGKVLGARAAKFVGQGDTVLITMHDPGISNLEQRSAGISQELNDRGIRWKIAMAHSTSEGSAEAISEHLRNDTSVRFVCATGQADTEGAGLAIERACKGGGLGVAGFDLSTEILRLIDCGIVKFTLDQQPYVQGFYPVIQLALYCRYGIRPSNMYAGMAIVTRSALGWIAELTEQGFR